MPFSENEGTIHYHSFIIHLIQSKLGSTVSAMADSNVYGVDEETAKIKRFKCTILTLLLQIVKDRGGSGMSKVSIGILNNAFSREYCSSKFSSFGLGKLKEFVAKACELQIDEDNKILVPVEATESEVSWLTFCGFPVFQPRRVPFSEPRKKPSNVSAPIASTNTNIWSQRARKRAEISESKSNCNVAGSCSDRDSQENETNAHDSDVSSSGDPHSTDPYNQNKNSSTFKVPSKALSCSLSNSRKGSDAFREGSVPPSYRAKFDKTNSSTFQNSRKETRTYATWEPTTGKSSNEKGKFTQQSVKQDVRPIDSVVSPERNFVSSEQKKKQKFTTVTSVKVKVPQLSKAGSDSNKPHSRSKIQKNGIPGLNSPKKSKIRQATGSRVDIHQENEIFEAKMLDKVKNKSATQGNNSHGVPTVAKPNNAKEQASAKSCHPPPRFNSKE